MKIYFLIFLILEIILGSWLTEWVGFWTTLLIYFVPTIFGLPLVIFENQMNWASFQKQMASGHAPDQPLLRLMAGFIGSLLMLIPSLIARLLALFLIFPPTRFLIVFTFRNWLGRKILAKSFSFGSGAEPPFERDARVIDIEAIKIPSAQSKSPQEIPRPKS